MQQRLPFSCILLRSGDTSPHTRGNALFDVFHIRFRIPRKPQRKYDTTLVLCCFPYSLIALQNNKWLHIPCQAEYSEPSFLHRPPVCMRKHNDYK